jgi:hypothetical protein
LEPLDASGSADDERHTLAVALARENELLHARVVEMSNLAEEAVALRVEAELAREAAERELKALLNTRTMRALRPLRTAYAKLRQRVGRVRVLCGRVRRRLGRGGADA